MYGRTPWNQDRDTLWFVEIWWTGWLLHKPVGLFTAAPTECNAALWFYGSVMGIMWNSASCCRAFVQVERPAMTCDDTLFCLLSPIESKNIVLLLPLMLSSSTASVLPLLSAGNQQVDAIHVTQLERDTVLVCLDRKYNFFSSASTEICTNSLSTVQMWVSVFCHILPTAFLLLFSPENLKIVNLQGRLKSNKKLASELSFDFCIGSVGKLFDRCWKFLTLKGNIKKTQKKLVVYPAKLLLLFTKEWTQTELHRSS